jgi:hypothetical protein
MKLNACISLLAHMVYLQLLLLATFIQQHDIYIHDDNAKHMAQPSANSPCQFPLLLTPLDNSPCSESPYTYLEFPPFCVVRSLSTLVPGCM